MADHPRGLGRAALADLVERDFTATRPNALWVADFTYLRCWEGRMYFAFLIDVFSRMIVGWQLATHMRTDLVLDALRTALGTRRPGVEVQLVHHSDAGQGGAEDCTQELTDQRVLSSIGTVGDAYDNALAESFVDSYKTELIADRVWRTRTELELATVVWVAWFNTVRLHSSLGDIPPSEFEALHTLEPAGVVSVVSEIGAIAAGALETSRAATLGGDRAARSPISPVSASAARSAPAQAAPTALKGRTAAGGLSDDTARDILTHRNIKTNHQTTKRLT